MNLNLLRNCSIQLIFLNMSFMCAVACKVMFEANWLSTNQRQAFKCKWAQVCLLRYLFRERTVILQILNTLSLKVSMVKIRREGLRLHHDILSFLERVMVVLNMIEWALFRATITLSRKNTCSGVARIFCSEGALEGPWVFVGGAPTLSWQAPPP